MGKPDNNKQLITEHRQKKRRFGNEKHLNVYIHDKWTQAVQNNIQTLYVNSEQNDHGHATWRLFLIYGVVQE